MSKLYSKRSPSFPVATDPLPNHKHEGVTLDEKLVVQEAKKDEQAVSTLQNTQTNRINTIDQYIFSSFVQSPIWRKAISSPKINSFKL